MKEDEYLSDKYYRILREYLEELVFYGLKNLNTGFDVPTIKYFDKDDFITVLKRVEELGMGIGGIEPWKDGQFYGVLTCEDFDSDPRNPEWYWKAFEDFLSKGEMLQWSASYVFPNDWSLPDD